VHIFHKWEKWKEPVEKKFQRYVMTGNRQFKDGIVVKRIQQRICSICGKIQETIISNYKQEEE
jgi:hypothetical protein